MQDSAEKEENALFCEQCSRMKNAGDEKQVAIAALVKAINDDANAFIVADRHRLLKAAARQLCEEARSDPDEIVNSSNSRINLQDLYPRWVINLRRAQRRLDEEEKMKTQIRQSLFEPVALNQSTGAQDR